MITNGRKTLGLFINRPDTDFMQVVQRVCRRKAKEMNYDLFIFITVGYRDSVNYYDTQEKAMFDFAPVQHLDGALVTPDSYDMEGFKEALFNMLGRNEELPVACIRDRDSKYDNFFTDEETAMRPMMEHLLDDHGYRKVCFQSGYEGHYDSEMRLKCYREEMEKRGIPLPKRAIYHGNLWVTRANEAYDYFFADPDDRPEAIVCANDYMAKALTDEIIARGLRVPEDVAVTGFDNIPDTATGNPTITTVCQDYEQMVIQAMETLHQRICAKEEGRTLPAPCKHPLPSLVALRESCGCPKCTTEDELRLDNNKLSRQIRSITQREVSQTYFSIELNVAEDYESIHNTILRKMADVPNIQDFYLCLFEGENGMMAEKITDNVRVISAVRNRTEGCSPNWLFNRETLLPAQVETDEPQAFYIHLHHQRDCMYGYSAVQLLDNETPTLFYMHWNIIISVALRNLCNQAKLAALYEERRLSSITDMLTGLYNRRGIDEQLSSIWPEYCSECRKMTFISLDMDNLKPINDTFGHQGGDMALCTIADAIRAASPENVLAARMGGDEFLVILPDGKNKDATQFCKKFNEYLQKVNQGQTCTVGASVGALTVELSKDSVLEQCIHDSDLKMYKVKKRRKSELKRHANSLK